ncbi:MAG: hypothetical protein GY719_31405 [bacterium]|nr:hypothetical protein [bacterium]
MHDNPSVRKLNSGIWCALVAAGCLIAATRAAAEEIPFDSTWKLGGDARVVETGAVPVLEIGMGVAEAPGVELENGTIEVDVQVSSHRSFAYVRFRDGGDRSWEEIYLRAHKSHLPDALQYTPVIGGVSQWQIFHGENGTAAAGLPAEQWIPVRLEFAGRKLAVFVGDLVEPTMVIARMAHQPRGGGIALRSFIPRTSEAPFGVRYRNLRVSPGRTTFDFDSVPAAAAPDPRTVTGWQASPVFAIEQKLYGELPEVDESTWRNVETEPDGTLLLDRLGRPEGVRAYGAVIRLRIDAAAAGVRSLDLGFSDAVSVFLNGSPLVGLDQSYRFDRPRVQGVMGLHQSRLHLPLEEGRNELRIVVTESFGGWGLIARWVDDAGITVVR